MTSIPVAPTQRQSQKILIRKEGGRIVARSADQVVQASSTLTDISQVIAAVLAGDLTSGRTWQETVRVVGDYECTETITMLSNTRLELDGRIRMQDGVAFNDAFSVHADGQSNFSIAGGVWDNNGPNHVGVGGEGFHQFAIRANNCQDVVLEGMEVLNAGRDSFIFAGGTTRVRCFGLTTDTSEDDGFNPLDCSHIEFHGCHAKNHVFDGFHLSLGCEDITVIGGSSTGNGDNGVKVLGDRVRILGLNTDGRGRINLNAGAVTIKDCTFGALAGFHSLHVEGSTNTERVSLIGNTVRGIVTAGDRAISCNRHRTLIEGNQINGCTGQYGIFMSIADECVINANQIDSGLTQANIKMNSGNNCQLRDNVCRNGVRGLHILAACNTTKLSGNILSGSTAGLSDSGTGTVLGGAW